MSKSFQLSHQRFISKFLLVLRNNFSDLVFDTCKMLFVDMFKGPKVPPSTPQQAYDTIFSKMGPFIGLQKPGTSSTSIGIPKRVKFVTCGRRRDMVDEILLSELYSEPPHLWTDFTEDIKAVKEELVNSLTEALINDLVGDLAPLFPKAKVTPPTGAEGGGDDDDDEVEDDEEEE